MLKYGTMKNLIKRKCYTNSDVVQIVRTGSNAEKADLAIALGFDCPDYGLAQSMCIQLLQTEDEIIRGNAVIGLAHIARRFRKLDKRVVKPYLLRELRDNVKCHDLIVDAVNSINLYLEWNIGDKGKTGFPIVHQERELNRNDEKSCAIPKFFP